jgi:HEXXH motif-containing protein
VSSLRQPCIPTLPETAQVDERNDEAADVNVSEYFLPSAARAAALRAAMTASWSESMVRVLGSHPEQASLPMVASLAGWAASALDFGVYFDLCLASIDDQSSEAKAVGQAAIRWLQHRFLEEKSARGRHTELQVSTLSELFYIGVDRARFLRWLDTDSQRSLAIGGIGPSRLICATRELYEAWFALGDVAPQLREEIAIISPEVLLVRSDEEASTRFDSVSSFCLWGCMALNTDTHFNSWDYFGSLVNGSAHNLLFAFARQQPLVLNPNDQRSNSPLRDDQRPIDTVFHAAFASAREVWALKRALTHSGRLPGDDMDPRRTGLLERLRTSAGVFWRCDEQLARVAKLSPLGENILQESRDHVLSSAAVVPPLADFDQHATDLMKC